MQSAFGLGLHSRFSPFTGPGAFGHYGIGGSFPFADRVRGLAVGYVTSQMMADAVGDPQTRAIRAAMVKAVPNV